MVVREPGVTILAINGEDSIDFYPSGDVWRDADFILFAITMLLSDRSEGLKELIIEKLNELEKLGEGVVHAD